MEAESVTPILPSIETEKERKAQEFLVIGNVFYEQKDFDSAIVAYTKAIEYNPSYSEAYYNRGLAYADKKEFEQAISDYTKAIELNPNDAQAMANLGDTFAQKGDKEQAKYWYEQALKHKDNLDQRKIDIVQEWLKTLEN